MWPFRKSIYIVQIALVNHDTFLEAVVQRDINKTSLDLAQMGYTVFDVRITKDDRGYYQSLILFKEKVFATRN